MIDPIKILQRAWHILWSYRTLWILGLMLALAGGGSLNGGANNGVQWREDSQSYQGPSFGSVQEAIDYFNRELNRLFREGIPEANITGPAFTAFLWTIGAFVLFMFLVSIVVTIAYYVSVNAVVRMVDEYETTGDKMSVSQGFRIGWSRTAWQLFLIDIVVHLPLLLFVLILLISGVSIFLRVLNGDVTLSTISLVALGGLFISGLFFVIILSFLLGLLRPFFWRVCVLENARAAESLRRGFAMVRENWKSAGLMWLVMFGLGIAWLVISILAIIVTIPIVILTSLVAALIVAIPALLLVAVFSAFLTGPLPWIAAGLFMLPLFFLIAFSPWLLLGSWKSVFASTVWTLTYREIKALPATAPQAELVPAGD